MKTVTSVSGGKSSALCAKKFKSDELVFSLVRTNNKKYEFSDRSLARKVSRKINDDFVGTLEDNMIIYTILDLEQYLGQKIHWVTGLCYEDVIKDIGYGFLPNGGKRFCTTEMKIRPIFHWWHEFFNAQPVIMNIGYRANEKYRIDGEKEKLNSNGLSVFKATFEKHKKGRHKGNNKWVDVPWRIPAFPLYDNGYYPQDVAKFWKDKPVRFAKYNNCIGCFNRSPAFLKKMSVQDPLTFDWFVNMEENSKGTWKKNISYSKIKKFNFTQEFDFEEEGCGSGFCGF